MATVWALIALRSALPTAPAAALTVRGASSPQRPAHPSDLQFRSDLRRLHHPRRGAVNAGAITLPASRGRRPSGRRARRTPLTSSRRSRSITRDACQPGPNWMFNAVFGTWPATYLGQPGVAVVDCPGGCDAGNINDAARARPGQPIQVKGSAGLLDIGGNIGSTTDPVLILAEGDVEFSGGTPTVVGAIYTREAAAWTLEGAGTIQGAAMAERDFSFAAGSPAITYDRDVLLNLRHRTGSFVKVPGGWRDFQP
ncbi:MAG: hypothetical protein IPM15_18385 [Betaproteobacteria bacterium]|nr:hypothetical protein [Betaproteobacteria bacterium]